MDKKTTIILTIVIILPLIAGGVYWFYFRTLKVEEGKPQESLMPEENLPTEEQPRQPQRQAQETKNIIQKLIGGKKNEFGAVYVLIAPERGLWGNPKYVVQYFNEPPYDLLLISLMGLHLDEAREEMEEMLLREAGGDLENLCKLKVSIGAPRFVYQEAEDRQQKTVIENYNVLNICRKN